MELPDIRQSHDFDCGAAAIDTVMVFHRFPAQRTNLASPWYGLAPDTMEALFRSVGLAVLAGTLRIQDLEFFTSSRRPVVCAIEKNGTGHWVVVHRVENDTVYYNDPEDGPSSLPVRAWLDRWQDHGRYGSMFFRYGLVAFPSEEKL